MIPIVAISGRAGSGKDSLATELKRAHFPDAVVMSFAKPLKDICINLFGLTQEQCWGPSQARETRVSLLDKQEFSERAHSAVRRIFPGGKEFDDGINKMYDFRAQFEAMDVPVDSDVVLTARHVLQQIGTEWGRAIDPEVWVKSTLRAATAALHAGKGPVFIADARFPNETWGVRGVGGLALLVKRPGLPELPKDVHVSEKWSVEAPDLAWDIVATNDGTIQQLAQDVADTIRCPGIWIGPAKVPSDFTRHLRAQCAIIPTS